MLPIESVGTDQLLSVPTSALVLALWVSRGVGLWAGFACGCAPEVSRPPEESCKWQLLPVVP